MKHIAARRGACLALAVLSAGCSSDVIFFVSTGGPVSASSATVGVPPGFPSVLRPARVYVAVNSPASSDSGSPRASRFVLYDDCTFALQYASANRPFVEYRGTYRESSGAISFEWEGRSAAGPWSATGSLSDQALSVRYNLVMQLSDFEDVVYTRDR